MSTCDNLKSGDSKYSHAGGQMTSNVAGHRQIQSSKDSFEDEGDSLTICGYGDVSLSEAYNIPAPTTGNYPLRPKRDRPPMPGRHGAKMSLLFDDDIPEETSDVDEGLSFALDESGDSSTSDILTFLETFKAARDASADVQAATTLALGHRINNLKHLPSRPDSATGSEPIGDQRAAPGSLDANSQDTALEAGQCIGKSNNEGTRDPYTQRQGFSQRWEGSTCKF